MSETKQEVTPAQAAMLVAGDEVYGVGTIEKIYAEGWPEMLFVCGTAGPMYDWLRERDARVELVEQESRIVAKGSVQTLLRMPSQFRAARRDAKRIEPLLRERGVLVVHTQWLTEQIIGGWLRKRGYRVAWQINNNMNRKRLGGLGQKLSHRLGRWGADLLMPASDFIGANWAGCGVPQVTIRNSAKPLPPSVRSLPDAPPVRCLVAGRLEHSKGHHVALEAVLSARERGIDVTLDIFGGPVEDNAYADALRTRITEAGAESAVRLMGFCTDLRERHAEYHLGLQCRIDPEPCSLWVCETLVDGMPIVASATGGTPELVDEGVTGLLVPPDDAGALGDAIVELAGDPERLATMRGAAAERGRDHFTTDRMLRQTLDAYQSLA